MSKHFISDPIFDEIEIDDELIFELINSKEFKRLSRLKQLGFTEFFYPTASHTRLSHSLGVYELARRMLIALGVKDLSISTKRAILAAALLHDLGHGPFSHQFESISKVRHEEYSILLIEDSSTEINKIFKKYDPLALKEVLQIMRGNHKLKWANQMISSEIDVDRLDYLLRDSMFTGKNYGNVDWSSLIKNTIIKDEELIFHWSAFPIIEAIILGRYHMNQVVYKSEENMASTELLLWFYNRLVFLKNQNKLKNDYEQLLKVGQEKILSASDFFALDDVAFLNKVKLALEEEDSILVKISWMILNQSIPNIIHGEEDIKTMIKEVKESEKHQTWAIIDLDLDFKFYQSNRLHEARILTEDDKILPIREFSTIIKRKRSTKNEWTKKIGIKLQ